MVTLKMRLFFLYWLSAVLSLDAFGQQQLQYNDLIYESQIKTVRFFDTQSGSENSSSPAVSRLSDQYLVIEFDELNERKSDFYAKILPCNFDWSASNLRDLEFLNDYNEFPINDLSFSLNTKVPYVHYRFPVPTVKVPGNYLLIIYRDGNKDNLVLSRRIMVYDLKAMLILDNQMKGIGNLDTEKQILNFSINYSRLQIVNPSVNLHMVMRQNERWGSAKFNLEPSSTNDYEKLMLFKNFDSDDAFYGGSEFRFVDLTSINSPGQNVKSVDRRADPVKITVALDVARSYEAYSLNPDINGNFTIKNNDYNQQAWISSDYMMVEFNLKSELLADEVFLIGAFNGWGLNEENQMHYDNNSGFYSTEILLKQGFYNYQYYVKTPNEGGNFIEGNHFQTENKYEIMVYYSSFQPYSDLLVGYFVVGSNY